MIRRPRKKFGGALGEAFDELWEAVEAGQIVESDFVSVDKTSRGVIVRARDGGGGIGDDGEQGEAGQDGEAGAIGPVGESTNSIYIISKKRLLVEADFFLSHSSEGMAASEHTWWIFNRMKVQWDGSNFTQTYNYQPAVALDGHEPEVGPDFPLPPIIPQGEYNLMADTSDSFAIFTADLANVDYSGIEEARVCPIMKTMHSYGFTYFPFQ